MKKESKGWLVHNKAGNIVHVSHRKDDLIVFPGETLTDCKIIYDIKFTTNTKRTDPKPRG